MCLSNSRTTSLGRKLRSRILLDASTILAVSVVESLTSAISGTADAKPRHETATTAVRRSAPSCEVAAAVEIPPTQDCLLMARTSLLEIVIPISDAYNDNDWFFGLLAWTIASGCSVCTLVRWYAGRVWCGSAQPSNSQLLPCPKTEFHFGSSIVACPLSSPSLSFFIGVL